MYKRAKSYAWMITKENYINSADLLHDAYLSFYDRSGGQDLFSQSAGLVFRVLRCIMYDTFKNDHRYWQYKGDRQINQTEQLDSNFYDRWKEDTRKYVPEDKVVLDSRLTILVTPETVLIEKETAQARQSKVDLVTRRVNLHNVKYKNGYSSKLPEIYDLLFKGYKQNEIAYMLDLTPSGITYYLKQLKN